MKKTILFIILSSFFGYSQLPSIAQKPSTDYYTGINNWSVYSDERYIDVNSPVNNSKGLNSELIISYNRNSKDYVIDLLVRGSDLCGKQISDKSYRDIEAYTDDGSYLYFQNARSRVYNNKTMVFGLKLFMNVPYGHNFKNQNFTYVIENLLANNYIEFKIPHIPHLYDEYGLPKKNPASSSTTYCNIKISLKGVKESFQFANLIE
tara:strand:- start:435 stop:1052 length:618 start_codon:yes stop_codon:yes gene_type:complete